MRCYRFKKRFHSNRKYIIVRTKVKIESKQAEEYINSSMDEMRDKVVNDLMLRSLAVSDRTIGKSTPIFGWDNVFLQCK
jgi:hypothetical protein